MSGLGIERSARPGSQPTCYTGDDKDLQLHRPSLNQMVGIAALGGLDCKIVQSNPLTPILRGMSKGAKMQAVFRDGQFLWVWR
jgi:hypothetical protein